MNKEKPTGAYVITGENARFQKSKGGLLSLSLQKDGAWVEYERVIVLRAFPLTTPWEFLSVRLPEGGRPELGMIYALSDLDGDSRAAVKEELTRRYLIPKIEKITSAKRRSGLLYLGVVCDGERRELILRDDAASIRLPEGGRVLLSEINGCTYEIEDPRRLDKASYRRIEIFL